MAPVKVNLCLKLLTLSLCTSITSLAEGDEIFETETESIKTTTMNPIDPSVLTYLADHLEPRECAQLSTFLAMYNMNSLSQAQNKNSWGGYGNGNKKSFFACHHTLKLWNENIAATEAENRLDGTEFIETILISGLKKIKRQDLATWLHNLVLQKRHEEISEMEEEWAKHKKSGQEQSSEDNSTREAMFSPKNFSNNNIEDFPSNHENDKEIDFEDVIPEQMYVDIILGTAGLLLVVGIALVIWCLVGRRMRKQSLFKPQTYKPKRESLKTNPETSALLNFPV